MSIIDSAQSIRTARRRTEMIEKLTALGLVVEDDNRSLYGTPPLTAKDPRHPDIGIQLRYEERTGRASAWFLGRPRRADTIRRFPLHGSGGFNYEGIAKAVREMAAERTRRREQLAETKTQLAKQEVEDERRRKHFQAERQKLVQYGFIAAEDRRVVADEDGLRLFIERRERDKDMAGLRMRVEINITEVGTADRMSAIVSGLKLANLWEPE